MKQRIVRVSKSMLKWLVEWTSLWDDVTAFIVTGLVVIGVIYSILHASAWIAELLFGPSNTNMSRTTFGFISLVFIVLPLGLIAYAILRMIYSAIKLLKRKRTRA